MSVIDSIQLSGTVYTLSAQTSGGVSESAFTAYTAATNTVIANKADLSAATMTSTTETTVDGGGDGYKWLEFNYDDGVYYLSARGNDEDFEAYTITLKDAPNGNTVNIDNTTSAGETDSYILSSSGRFLTITTKGNYRITTAILLVENEGFTYQYKTRTVVSKAVSTYIEEDINPTLSGKVDSSTYTAYTAATDTALAGKQTTLTAGTGIDITDNVISATGGGGGNPTVELTQAQYDALVTAGTVSADTYYIITDAQAVDLTNYYTKSETNTLLNGKQATLVSGTNIKTINNESLLGSGNIDIQGGGVDVVQTTGTSTTDVMSQDAVTTQLNGTVKLSNVSTFFVSSFSNYTNSLGIVYHRFDNDNTSTGSRIWYGKINGKYTCGFGNPAPSDLMNLSVVETSAITTSVTSASTDSQVPSAKAVYDAIQEGGGGTVDQTIISGSTNAVAGGAVYNKIDEVEEVTAAGLNAVNDKFDGLKLKKLTQSQYDALSPNYDSNTVYFIGDSNGYTMKIGNTSVS